MFLPRRGYQYEAYVGLRFLTNARGRTVQRRRLDKYIIGSREAHIFPDNPLGNKSKSDAEKFARMDWDVFVVQLDAKNLWKRFYRMSKGSFFKLLELVRLDLEKNSLQTLRSTNAGAITPELRLSITLRWLAGASYQDVAIIHGVDFSSVYLVAKECIASLDSRGKRVYSIFR